MSILKSTFKRWNGSAWDIHYFRTSADVIDETTSYKIMTADERTAIANYLNSFNAANKLLKLDGNGKVPVSLIPGGLNYLTKNNPSFTGILKGKQQEGSWLAGGSLFKLSSHNTSDSGSGLPGFIEFKADQGDYVDLELSASQIKLTSLNGVDVNNKKITNVANPTAPLDATNKSYVDGLIASGTRPVDPVKAATTKPISLTGLQKIDDYMTVAGDRILVKDQTGDGADNGIYTASATAWSRIHDDSTAGKLTFVENGTVNNDSQFFATSNTSWSLFSRVDTITVSGGLRKVGTDISVASSGITNDMLAAGIRLSKLESFASNDSVERELLPATASRALKDHLEDIYSSIKRLRGAADYATHNGQTIAGAYDAAAEKNRTYTGNSDPGTVGYATGDLFFQDIV